ncbi:hypothetical protein GGR55DRAFT_653886 [Xylaria sp. FL0064]|nr:hypothetical protein GGR55DRAFT_653886 [Xylaria sp. FL0064]
MADVAAAGCFLRNPGLSLLLSLENHAACRILSSQIGHGHLNNDISKLIFANASNPVHSDRIKPLLRAVLARQPDLEIWQQVYHTVTESTPPRRTIFSVLDAMALYYEQRCKLFQGARPNGQST